MVQATLPSGAMATLDIIPRSWLSWNSTIKNEQGDTAELAFKVFSNGGTITTPQARLEIRRETGLIGDWLLLENGNEVARIQKPTAFARTFVVSWPAGELRVRPQSALSRKYVIHSPLGEVGRVAPRSFAGRRATATVPDEAPFVVQAFLSWMVVMLWRRASSAAAGGA